jgi:hypothetical protein
MKKIITGIILLIISLFIMFLVFTFQGCATTSSLCPKDGSAICALSDKLGASPESLSQVLQIANVAALEKSLYTAKEANQFVDQIIKDVQAYRGKTITYVQAIKYLNDKFNVLSPQIQACFIIMNPADLATKEISIPSLSKDDINMIINHLKKQKALISVYL